MKDSIVVIAHIGVSKEEVESKCSLGLLSLVWMERNG